MSNQITSDILLVTPQLAGEWLSKNIDNRSIRRAHVEKLMKDMTSGNWHMTDESIKFDLNGHLIDGQHRLHAVVRSGVPVVTRVTRGIAPEAQKYMDTNSSRAASDALQFSGYRNTAILAAMARIAIAIREGIPHYRSSGATHSQVLEWVESTPMAQEAATFASTHARKTDCKASMVGYTFLRFSEIDAEDAYEFWIAAAEKVDLRQGDPVIALTNRFAEARRRREILPNDAHLSLIYRAWNYRREGRPWRKANINSPGANGGMIPIPEPR